ncbi:MAG: SLBB domain-containing protein [Oscillospiraceae bacterium]|nr:SLBB domain-containing protein [Oscillospiraceae bacterium]
MGLDVRFITQNFGEYDPMSIDSYLGIGGYRALKKALKMDGEDIASLIAEAKVKGRGGAAYDMGRKWSQSRAVKAPHKVVICNADEGETCTFKDRELITNDPFNLIEAITICGYTVNAQDGYIYMRDEYRHLRPRLLNAIKQAEEKGFLGDKIQGTDFSFRIHLYSGAGAYVCGEGTALIRSIEGKAGRPRMKPPFMKVSGLFALPTCVNNVESFSIVPHLLLDDDRKYVSYGSGESLGTKLISLGGNVRRPGVYEIPFGTTVRDIVYDLGQGIPGGRSLRLIQFGGASGKVSDGRILDTPYTYDDLKAAGVTVGSGSVLVIDDRTSVLDFLRMTQDFFSDESCGQCTPCREGNLHIKLFLEKMAKGEATPSDIREMKKIAKIMSISSLCGLGESAQNALLSAMNVFPKTFEVGGAN